MAAPLAARLRWLLDLASPRLAHVLCFPARRASPPLAPLPQAQALNLLQDASEGRGSLGPDVRAALYQTVARTGDAEVYTQLVRLKQPHTLVSIVLYCIVVLYPNSPSFTTNQHRYWKKALLLVRFI